jgi:hypothetical protein
MLKVSLHNQRRSRNLKRFVYLKAKKIIFWAGLLRKKRRMERAVLMCGVWICAKIVSSVFFFLLL